MLCTLPQLVFLCTTIISARSLLWFKDLLESLSQFGKFVWIVLFSGAIHRLIFAKDRVASSTAGGGPEMDEGGSNQGDSSNSLAPTFQLFGKQEGRGGLIVCWQGKQKSHHDGLELPWPLPCLLLPGSRCWPGSGKGGSNRWHQLAKIASPLAPHQELPWVPTNGGGWQQDMPVEWPQFLGEMWGEALVIQEGPLPHTCPLQAWIADNEGSGWKDWQNNT